MTDRGEDGIDWTLTTWEGVRQRHNEEFMAISQREKIQALEDMEEIINALNGKWKSKPDSNSTDLTNGGPATNP